MTILKKTSYCNNCGFLDTNNFCRLGLGWRYIEYPEIEYCKDQWPILPKRCGTCYWYVLTELDTDSTPFPTCSKFGRFSNFFEYCPWYEYKKGKSIRPKADEVPLNIKEIWPQSKKKF